MIIDAFLFYQEYEILEFRLRMLYEHVDKFVIVEADKTFSGKNKTFNYEEHAHQYDWAADKIKYFKLHFDISGLDLDNKPKEFDANHDCWKIECAQRDAFIAACKYFADDDLLIMGDVDEIPSIEAITWAKQNISKLPVVCQQHFFYYDLRYLRQEICLTTIFSTLYTARSIGAQELRNRRPVIPKLINSGWHLSYFGDVNKIRQKIEAFSHQELNIQEFKEENYINQCRDAGTDLFKREISSVAVSSEFFPEYFRKVVPEHWWGSSQPVSS